MTESKFISLCKQSVCDYVNKNYGIPIAERDIYLVWFSKNLQNASAVLSTVLTENIYFEANYDGDHRTLYLDSYLKKQDGGIAILTD